MENLDSLLRNSHKMRISSGDSENLFSEILIK